MSKLQTVIDYHFSSLSRYIDSHVLCDGVGVRSKKCTELLNLKGKALNFLDEAEAYCNKAIRIATNTDR